MHGRVAESVMSEGTLGPTVALIGDVVRLRSFGATADQPSSEEIRLKLARDRAKPAVARRRRAKAGEPARNRTENPQIKSLLLCQLSYWPTRKGRAIVTIIAPKSEPRS